MQRSVTSISRMGLFVAIMAVLSYVQIPLPFTPVPLTGQLTGVFLTGIMLGGRDGALAVFIYLLMGMAGLPVFAGGRGGLQIILGPTGGYLLGFIPGILALGSIVSSNKGDRGKKDSPANLINTDNSVKENIHSNYILIIGMLACLLIVYACGSLQLSFIMNLDAKQALLAGVVPYIPLDLIKIVITLPLARKLRNIH